MKKILSFILAGIMLTSFAACNKNNEKSVDKEASDNKGEAVTETDGKAADSDVNGKETAATEKESDNTETAPEKMTEKVSVYADTVEGNSIIVSADVFYPSDAGLEPGEGYTPYEGVIVSEDSNYVLNMCLYEDDYFESNKESAKEDEESYTEYKLSGFDSFGYESFGDYYVYIHLEKISDSLDRYIEVYMSVYDYEKEPLSEGVEFFENKEVQKILDSIVYNGTVPYDSVDLGYGSDEVTSESGTLIYNIDKETIIINKPSDASFFSEPEPEGQDMLNFSQDEYKWMIDVWGAMAFDYGEATDPFAYYYFNGELSESESEFYEVEEQKVTDLGIEFNGKPVKLIETTITDLDDGETDTDIFVGFEFDVIMNEKPYGDGLLGYQIYMYEELPSNEELARIFSELFGI